MPKTVREVIAALGAKAKIDMTSEDFVNAMSAPDLDRLTIPDTIFDSIDNGLIDMVSAKNHPDIKNHFFSQAYDGLDMEVNRTIDELKLPEDVRNELKSEKSSTKRAALLARKAIAVEAKKHASGSVDKERYAKEIADLNESVRLLKEAETATEANWQKKLRDKDMGYAMKSLMGAYNNTIHEHLPAEVKAQIIEAQLNVALKQNNATWGLDDNGNVTLLRADGQPVYGPNNTPMSPKTFIDKTLADNKQLKINDQPAPAAGATQQRYQQTGQQQVIPGRAVNSAVTNRNNQRIADLEASVGTSMI